MQTHGPSTSTPAIEPGGATEISQESEFEPPTILDEPIERPVTQSPTDPALASGWSRGDSRNGAEAGPQMPSPVPHIEDAPLTDVVPQADLEPAAGSHPVEASAHGNRQAALLVVDEDAPTAEATETHTAFEIKCFGSFQVLAQGKEVDGWTIQKARELLAYLVARGGTRVTREEAADALWPDEPADRVLHLLSNAAYYVRRTLKESTPSPNGRFLTVKEQRYRTPIGHLPRRPGRFRCPPPARRVAGRQRCADRVRPRSVHLRGDFMGNEPYEWAEPYRRDYQRRFVTAAHRPAASPSNAAT